MNSTKATQRVRRHPMKVSLQKIKDPVILAQNALEFAQQGNQELYAFCVRRIAWQTKDTVSNVERGLK